jgi:hypothetical protein
MPGSVTTNGRRPPKGAARSPSWSIRPAPNTVRTDGCQSNASNESSFWGRIDAKGVFIEAQRRNTRYFIVAAQSPGDKSQSVEIP